MINYKGERLCYDTCAHNSYGGKTDPYKCNTCAYVRRIDGLIEEIRKLIRNNMNKPLTIEILELHLGGWERDGLYSVGEIQSACFEGTENGRLKWCGPWRYHVGLGEIDYKDFDGKE